jgi:hypothetical protein
LRRILIEIVDMGKHFDAAQAIGHDVTHVKQQSSPTLWQTLHQGDGPERTGDVHRRLDHHFGDVQYFTHRSGLWYS